MIERLVDYLERQLVPVMRRRPLRRLASDILAFEGTMPLAGNDHPDFQGIRASLESAKVATTAGDIERGWKCFQAAQRLRLSSYDDPHRMAFATVLRKEAVKLSNWRKDAVLELLDQGSDKKISKANLSAAVLLRDEHYDNEAYKNGLQRNNALRLAIVFIFVLLALLWTALNEYWPKDAVSPANALGLFKALLSVSLFGLFGATVSAILDVPNSRESARIPEMLSTIRVTILRLLMGAASAIIIYLFIQSKLSAVVIAPPDGFTILIVAFVAGFTERLVLRVVETVAKAV